MVMLVNLVPHWLVLLPLCLLFFVNVICHRRLLYTALPLTNVIFVKDFNLMHPGIVTCRLTPLRVL